MVFALRPFGHTLAFCSECVRLVQFGFATVLMLDAMLPHDKGWQLRPAATAASADSNCPDATKSSTNRIASGLSCTFMETSIRGYGA